MNARAWWQLAVLSIRDPAQAAVALLAMRPGRDVLWPALLLAAALNTLVFSLSDILLPAPPVFPPILHQPLAYFAMITLGLVGFIQLLTWIGRLLGGQGGFADMMVLLVWLQYLRLLVQAAALVLVLTLPVLSLVVVATATIVGVYILLHFVSKAHGLNSLGRAAITLILTMLAMAFAISILIALLGGPVLESAQHV